MLVLVNHRFMYTASNAIVIPFFSLLLFLFLFICCTYTGYLDQGLLVRDAAKLRKHYFTTKGWRLDFLSVLPTDFAYFWWMPGKCHIQVPCPVIVRLNRLFRLPRMLEWFERTETATGYPNAFRICKVSQSIQMNRKINMKSPSKNQKKFGSRKTTTIFVLKFTIPFFFLYCVSIYMYNNNATHGH